MRAIFPDMALPRYSPPIERIKEEYSRMIARRVMAARRPPRPPGWKPGPKIPDNSVPWVENPRTVADLWEIAQCVGRCVKEVQQWQAPSAHS